MKRSLLRVCLFAVLLILSASMPPSAKAATLEVFSAADSGAGTLRQRLLEAQPLDTITFRASVFPANAPVTIFLLASLPPLAKNNLTIDGTGAGVIIDGSRIPKPGNVNGLTISADNCVVRGLTIQNFAGDFGNGISIIAGAANNTVGGDRSIGQGNIIVDNGGNGVAISGAGATSNVVRGNNIGADRAGANPRRNRRNGVAIWDGASNNTVGGTTENNRNVIGGNQQNGVWIAGAATTGNLVIGNYLGTRADGMGPLDNLLAGVGIHDRAHHNRIGGTASGTRNLISNNQFNGVDIRDLGTSFNEVLGNIIGLNKLGTAVLGGLLNGVIIWQGATNNIIGNNLAGGGNIISGNQIDGVRIEGAATANNVVQGNLIGSNIGGTAAMPNGLHGVDITDGAHHNLIGGDRTVTQGNPLGQGNLLSGNRNHGLVIHFDAHHNTASGNLIGPGATGSYSLGFHPNGGSDIAEGAHDNVIGGARPGEANVISGNQTDGIALFDNTGRGTNDNQIIGNLIGLTLAGQPLGNNGPGIASLFGARRTLIISNTVAFNATYAAWVAPCTGISIGNKITRNSIYANKLGGISTNCSTPAPTLRITAAGANETVSGNAAPNTRVEIFSDDGNQGRFYEGAAQTNSSGNFSFSPTSGSFAGPNLTATSLDASGNTSAFSQPAHLLWTLLLYLNGDNDLSKTMSDMVSTITAAGASPRATVIALVDGKSKSDTALYDLTNGQATNISTGSPFTGERNMGDKQTLIDFVTYVRLKYPSRHNLLSIVDHGGGWAPNGKDYIPGATPRRGFILAGGSGLSWDFNPGPGFPSDYDYLDSTEMRQSLSTITNNGVNKLDVLFYDVCLMGMIEVAYQIKDYASYFVSSQNIGWAPIGPRNRYVLTIQGIAPTTKPPEMAQLLVDSYASGNPPKEHPFTISAVDLTKMTAIIGATNQLALATTQRVPDIARARLLKQAYEAAQKIDYDSDFKIEPATDGFVDLYDFAQKIKPTFNDPVITKHANDIISALDTAIIAERHQVPSEPPWKFKDRPWNLDNVHGLSIFLPLGEDLLLPVTLPQTASAPAQVINIPLRQTYTDTQLLFVRDTAWRGLIDKYYKLVPVPTATTSGPVDGLLTPDVISPTTTINVTPARANIRVGQPITLQWSAVDKQQNADGTTDSSGVGGATLWAWFDRAPGWKPVETQSGSSGVFTTTPSTVGCRIFAVRAIDNAGNVEDLSSGRNSFLVLLSPGACPNSVYIPLVVRE
jgi:hypothetical protein